LRRVAGDGGLKLLEPRGTKVREGCVHLRERWNKNDGAIPSSCEKNAIGIDPELVRVTDVGTLLVCTSAVIGPSPVAQLKIASPSQKHCVQFEALGAELGHAILQTATGTPGRAVLRIAVPGAKAQLLRRVPVVRDPESSQIAISRRREQSEASIRVACIAIREVPLAYFQITGEAKMISGRFEIRSQESSLRRLRSREKFSHEAMQVAREVEAQLYIEIESLQT